uniref:LCCL domain-containing protein n=1 Tax=Leptobrachium leishanense TaxID=445787 RepID=A0A8C5PVN2_9ANUR
MFECPENCHKQNGAVWGTDTYSALSAVCIAALHAGVSTIAGGQFFLTLMPGEVSYQKSTRNGVTTQQMGAGSKSFKLSLTYEFLKTTYTEFSYYLPETAMASGSKLDTVSADCSLTGAQLSAPLMIVICPKNCMIRKVTNLEPGIYTEDSSVCGAALDAGKIDKNGGSAMVQKNQGQRQGTFQFNSLFDFQTTTNTETSYGLHNTAGDMTMINQPVTVNAACTWTGLDLPAPITSVKCPENCKKPKVDVWGTDIYAIESLLCASAMHGGYANNNGGQFIAYLKPGQDSYEGTTRHGVTSSRQGQSSKSFVLSSSYDISSAIFTESSYGGPEKEMTWDSWYAIVPGTCSLTGKDLTASVNMIYCPKGCMKENGEVFGFKLYSYNSHICLSAVHANQVNEDGGNVIVKMLPGSLSYTGVLSNGIISKSHGKSPASFEFTASFDFQSTIQTESSYNVPQIETKVEPMAPSAWAPQVKQQSGYSKFFNRWG